MNQPDITEMSKLLRRSLARIEQLEQQLSSQAASANEPIAIVGMACRLPGGVDTPEQLWAALERGLHAVREIPAERWPVDAFSGEFKGARWAGLLDGVDRFDAELFGITPREALRIDPQQRLLLEVAYEALERSGLAGNSALSRRTGTYVGITTSDYMDRLRADGQHLDAQASTGNGLCFAAGRLAFSFGFEGPALSIDTACSSSLVSVHTACEALRRGECDRALAGGVNLLLSPVTMQHMARTQALSPDGYCRSFDARANGFVRAEGCGMLVLRRLRDAEAGGEPVLALIRGSAVNQDGRSSGLTAPNALAQQRVIRDALARAGVEPSAVSYVETHGTGTPMGDPIEAEALRAVYGRQRASQPCVLGALKTNLGHLEAAAGVAGLIKTVLVLAEGRVPANLHFEKLNPRIDLGTGLRVADRVCELPAQGSRLAAVSSFGISGTNAHLILEAAPSRLESEPAALPQLLTLSARTATALRARAAALSSHLAERPQLDLARVCHAANVNDAALECRRAFVVHERTSLLTELAAFARSPASEQGCAPAGPRRVAFLFSGQGGQYVGMGKALYEAFPPFRTALDRCAAHYRRTTGRGLLAPMFAGEGDSEATELHQPALFSLQYALCALWAGWGIEPQLVLGHSLGEYAAACAAGVFEPETGLDLLVARARLLDALPTPGTMAAVRGELAVLRRVLAAHPEVEIGAFNGPHEFAVSGRRRALSPLLDELKASGFEVQDIKIRFASHSAEMDPLLAPFAQTLAGAALRPPRITFVSSVTGSALAAELATPRYWCDNIRQPVRFASALETALAHGADAWVEIGPRSTLLGLLRASPKLEPEAHVLVPSLRQGCDERATLLEFVGRLFEHGAPVARERLVPTAGVTPSHTVLPSYPFERKSYWIDAVPAVQGGAGDALRTEAPAPVKEALPPWGYRLALEPRALHATAETGCGAILLVGAETDIAPFKAAQALGRELRSTARDQLRAALAHCDAATRVVYVAPNAAGSAAAELCDAALDVVRAVQAHAGTLWWVTRGAQTVAGQAAPCSVAHAALWGLGRSVALEAPELWGGLIDLDPDLAPDNEAERLFAVLDAAGDEDQFVLRASGGYVARLLPEQLPALGPVAVRSDRGYLISGGLGGLGLELARWLVHRGARELVLTASPQTRIETLDPRRAAVLETLRNKGAAVRVVPADLAERAAVERLLAELDRPLAGVFHAAGVLRGERLSELTPQALRAVIAPKLDGALHLDALTRGQPLDWFVLFSSAAGIWGGERQGHYAAASHALDALAHRRRSESLPALSVDWGYWKAGGMGGADAEAHLARIGMRAMATQPALDVLDTLLQTSLTQAVVADLDWPRFRQVYEARKPRQLLSRLGAPERADVTAGARALLALPRAAARERIATLVAEQLARVFRYESAARIDRRRGFADMGMDSLMAVELGSALRSELGLTLPATVAFDYPTTEKLADYLVERLWQERAVSAAEPTLSAAALSEPIAVIGAACRVPGQAHDLEAFWRLLLDGVDCVQEAPARWRADEHDPERAPGGKMYSHWCSSLGDIESFDAALFRISPREALTMDPQQRVLLEVAWEALENAGCAPDGLAATKTGVFIGVAANEYQHLVRAYDPEGENGYGLTGNGLSFVPGRLSYALGLQGPSVAVDTACSSSLAAVHLACQSLRTGESAMALVGAANLILLPDNTIALCQLRALSPTGRCRTFDAGADGFVRGEGSAVLVLKRLRDAQAAGDQVMAVIRGSALNHDGQSSGFTVPNGPAQQAVIRSALAASAVAPRELGYLEAHGTGTALGDPIEMEALASVYGSDRPTNEPLLVGSLKTNFGHLEVAAGVVGLLKALLCVQRGYVPPHLHLDTPSPHIAWDRMPVRVPRTALPWPAHFPRRLAAVSAFGMSGTNVHVVVEAAPAAPQLAVSEGTRSWPLGLSAQTPRALAAYAARLADRLEAEPALPLSDVAYTLLCRRARLPERAGFVAGDSAEVVRQLRALAGGDLSASAAGRVDGGAAPRVAFLCTGQGAQYVGMGRALYERFPAFRDVLDRADRVLRPLLGRSLLALLYPRAGASEGALDATEFAQPALFAFEIALASLWRALGVEPALVLGHSIGEFAAACLAGVISFEQGLELVAERGRLMQGLFEEGAMLAVSTDAASLAPYLRDLPELSIAAFNGPASLVLSGPVEQISSAAQRLQSAGIRAHRLAVSHAFHSALMAPIEEDFARAAAAVAFAPAQIPVISSVSGRPEGAALCSPQHWVRQLREPVRWLQALDALAAARVDIVIEIGPDPILVALLAEHPAHASTVALACATRRDATADALLQSALALDARGLRIVWQEVFGADARFVQLPTYAFDRTRFWPDLRPEPRVAPLYRVEWAVHSAEGTPPADRALGRFVLFADGTPFAMALEAKLEQAGAAVALHEPWPHDLKRSHDPAAPERLAAALGTCSDVLFVCSQPRRPGAAPGALCRSLLPALQSTLTQLAPRARGWFVTVDAQAALPEPEQATIWGLRRTLALEHPELQPTCIDLSSADPSELQLAALLDELRRDDEPERVRAGRTRALRRLRAFTPGHVQQLHIDAEGVYLVTGGTGALGRQVAHWLIEQGARHVCSIARHRAGDDLERTATNGSGAVRVRQLALDVNDRARLAAGLDELRSEGRPIRGVIHAAGVLSDGVLLQQSSERFEQVFAPKASGAESLSALTAGDPLQFFALFSSAASVLGSPGQAGYAAANAYLDALAVRLRADGVPAISLQWGPWGGAGMAERMSEAGKRAWLERGMRALEPELALSALPALLAGAAPCVALLPLDFDAYLRSAPQQGSLLSELSTQRSAAVLSGDLAERVRAAPAAERRALCLQLVLESTRRVLHWDESAAMEPQQSFRDMGMDSLMALELRNRLVSGFELSLTPTQIFNHPTPERLAGYVHDALCPPQAQSSQEPSAQHDALKDMGEAELLALLDASLDSIERASA